MRRPGYSAYPLLLKTLAFLAVGCILLIGSGEPRRAQGVNETPRQTNASLYQPCAFELGDLTGPLKILAQSQNYTYFEYTNSTAPRPPNTSPATLDNFVTLDAAGVFQIATHATGDRLLVEAYHLDDVGTPNQDDDGDGQIDEPGEGRDTRLKAICNGTVRPGGVRLTCPADVWKFSGVRMVQRGTKVAAEPQDYGIGLSKAGITKVSSTVMTPVAITITIDG